MIPLPLNFNERAKLAVAAYYGTDASGQNERDRSYELLRMVSVKINFFKSKCDRCGGLVDEQDGLVFERNHHPGTLYHVDCVKEHCGISTRKEPGRLF